jgi:hypothetical protein
VATNALVTVDSIVNAITTIMVTIANCNPKSNLSESFTWISYAFWYGTYDALHSSTTTEWYNCCWHFTLIYVHAILSTALHCSRSFNRRKLRSIKVRLKKERLI